MLAFTDYPILTIGDIVGEPAPIRVCDVISYDRDKYCLVYIDGVSALIKRGYLYTRAGRCGKVPRISEHKLKSIPITRY
jgi:hypothetical protein